MTDHPEKNVVPPEKMTDQPLDNAAPSTPAAVDEAKIAELLMQFEREASAPSYPYWRRGILWGCAAAVITALGMAVLYANSGVWWRPVFGVAVITLVVWVGTTFLPARP